MIQEQQSQFQQHMLQKVNALLFLTSCILGIILQKMSHKISF